MHDNSIVFINSGATPTVPNLVLPTTRVQIFSDASRGKNGGTPNLPGITKEFKLYHDSVDHDFSAFDSVWYELMSYRPKNRKIDSIIGYYPTQKRFVHPNDANSDTNHAGASTHNGSLTTYTSEWAPTSLDAFQKTIVSVDARRFFKNGITGGDVVIPLKCPALPIYEPYLGYRLPIYVTGNGGNRKANKHVIAFRMCGKIGNKYYYGPMSDKIAMYFELKKNDGELAVDSAGAPLAVGDRYYSGVSANFSDTSHGRSLL